MKDKIMEYVEWIQVNPQKATGGGAAILVVVFLVIFL
jgi:hypothetical protein